MAEFPFAMYTPALRKKGQPRSFMTYRAFRRNFVLRTPPRSTWPGVQPDKRRYLPPVRPNKATRKRTLWDRTRTLVSTLKPSAPGPAA